MAQGPVHDFPVRSFRLGSLIFHVTESCNLRCRHCWQSATPIGETERVPSSRGFVTRREFEGLIGKLVPLGLRSVKFTGGEPLLCKRWPNYLEIARRHGLSVSLETNGTLISKEVATMLARFEPSVVAIGIDGPDADSHDAFRRSKGAFRRTIKGVQNLVRVGVGVQIISTLARPAVKSMQEMGRLASDLGVGYLKFNPVQPVGRGADLSRGSTALSIEELLEANQYSRNEMHHFFGGQIHMSLPLAFQPFMDIHAGKMSICQILSILALLPNGDFSLCGIGCINNKTLMGNIRSDDVERLWAESPLLRELRSRLPNGLKGVCGRCLLRSVCLGECRAAAFDETGDWMAPFWICQQAMDRGLFPPSRLEDDRKP